MTRNGTEWRERECESGAFDKLGLLERASQAERQYAALCAAAKALIDSLTFDESGVMGHGGNGGLISRQTIRLRDELQQVVSRQGSAAADLEKTA